MISAAVADALMEHSRLVGMRRYEHVTHDTYSTVNFNEAQGVLARWQQLAAKVRDLAVRVDEARRPTFFQLVQHPVLAGAHFHAVAIKTALNYRYALERRNSANLLAAEVLDEFDGAYDLTEEWDAMLDGKWADMMLQAVYDAVEEPKRWANPARDIAVNLSYVQLRQNMQPSLGNLGLYAEGSPNAVLQGRWAESVDASMPTTNYGALLPQMDPYGPSVRYVELFHRGDHRVPIEWSLDPLPVPWLTITPANGTLHKTHPDQRLAITIDWPSVPPSFNDTVLVGIRSRPSRIPYFDLLRIPVLNLRAPPDFTGFPESAGYVSIEAPHLDLMLSTTAPANDTSRRSLSLAPVGFAHVPHLGTRSASGSIALRPFRAAREDPASARAAAAVFPFYLFSGAERLEATVYINAGLDTDPALKMEFSLTVDAAPANFTRVLGDYVDVPAAGAMPPEWMPQVMDQVWTKKVNLGKVEAGERWLVWRTNSPEVYLEKIVLDTGGRVGASYLGPPETRWVEGEYGE
ncbi:hypothetical protein VTJ83DRAFT_2703 [Remersonia thermophila]|uniref:Gylcosyl hydrolase 115 C-terminal domain-containing protein n=1 Tax=Remersonia thermophila TaxID=72144 RepID=A0ABR4DJL4_9PEZI